MSMEIRDLFMSTVRAFVDSYRAYNTQLTVSELIQEFEQYVSETYRRHELTPQCLNQLYKIADKEQGWIQVVLSVIQMIPLVNPTGSITICTIVHGCPLPLTRCLIELTQQLKLSKQRANNINETNVGQERNICMVMGLIGDKFAGSVSIEILTEDVLDYLFTFIVKPSDPNLVLHALIALEKFAMTKENKVKILKKLNAETQNPLLNLENITKYDEHMRRQIVFCANWTLDNLFVIEGRRLSYLTTDMSSVNAILYNKDSSQRLKLSPDGLEARNDTRTFETVRCTYRVNEGCWYYEVTVLTSGVMHIGWATDDSLFNNNDKYSVGDDPFSISYDGCRQLVWHAGLSIMALNIPKWKSGDVLGCLLDLQEKKVIYSLNGVRLPSYSAIFTVTRYGFYAAASLMEFQQCHFNFGYEPFKFPPSDRYFSTFNGCGFLTEEEKIVRPRRLCWEESAAQFNESEDPCIVCFNNTACIILEPCKHRGFCVICAIRVDKCPLCRIPIRKVQSENNNRETTGNNNA